jgi:hypothetical protein
MPSREPSPAENFDMRDVNNSPRQRHAGKRIKQKSQLTPELTPPRNSKAFRGGKLASFCFGDTSWLRRSYRFADVPQNRAILPLCYRPLGVAPVLAR